MRVLRVVAADERAFVDLRDRRLDRLSHFCGDECAKIFLSLVEKIGGFIHPFRSLGEGALAVALRGFNRSLQLLLNLVVAKWLESF